LSQSSTRLKIDYKKKKKEKSRPWFEQTTSLRRRDKNLQLHPKTKIYVLGYTIFYLNLAKNDKSNEDEEEEKVVHFNEEVALWKEERPISVFICKFQLY